MLKEHTVAATRSATMHDRGHAYYGTACPDRCEIVNRWAARRLITPRAFLHAARTSADLEGMAVLLGLTPGDVCAYLAVLNSEEWGIMQKMVGRRLYWKD